MKALSLGQNQRAAQIRKLGVCGRREWVASNFAAVEVGRIFSSSSAIHGERSVSGISFRYAAGEIHPDILQQKDCYPLFRAEVRQRRYRSVSRTTAVLVWQTRCIAIAVAVIAVRFCAATSCDHGYARFIDPDSPIRQLGTSTLRLGQRLTSAQMSRN
jgi:hypothetical protein